MKISEPNYRISLSVTFNNNIIATSSSSFSAVELQELSAARTF